MRFIILTQYFPPETGAPQNRLHSLALNLLKQGNEVQVLTAMPNYPKYKVFKEYKGKIFSREVIDGIDVRRSWIYVSKSKSILKRLLNYFSFVLTVLIIGLRVRKADYLICESPPIFLGISALLLARLKKAKFIFNVSDLWPESAEKLGLVTNKTLLKHTYRLEARLYKSAFLVTGQTQGIIKSINDRFPSVPTKWLPNGIDEDVYARTQADSSWRIPYQLEGKKVFMYAGILGHAQGLEVIIKAASRLKEDKYLAFVIVGDGPVKSDLEQLNKSLSAGVIFIPNTPKIQLLNMVADAYSYIVPLIRIDLYKGAIPSKLFDPLALGIPILLGVEGEAKELFIDEGNAGLFFEPENDKSLVSVINHLAANDALCKELGANGRKYVYTYFNRKNIASSFIEELNNLKK